MLLHPCKIPSQMHENSLMLKSCIDPSKMRLRDNTAAFCPSSPVSPVPLRREPARSLSSLPPMTGCSGGGDVGIVRRWRPTRSAAVYVVLAILPPPHRLACVLAPEESPPPVPLRGKRPRNLTCFGGKMLFSGGKPEIFDQIHRGSGGVKSITYILFQ